MKYHNVNVAVSNPSNSEALEELLFGEVKDGCEGSAAIAGMAKYA